MKKIFVTGAAGFVGSNLVDRLLSLDYEVTGWDNFSTGLEDFLIPAGKNSKFRLIRGDNLDLPALTKAMEGCDFVFHLAANADVRFGLEHPRKDVDQNILATFNVLEAMRENKVRGIAFSSTGSVYGEATVIPTPEDAPFPVQTSLYGTSKLASEGLIASYCEGFGIEGYVFRFVSVLGERYTHGHVVDFYRNLKKNPDHLKVLGNGGQKKSYMYVQDCLNGMLLAIESQVATRSKHRFCVFNLGTPEYSTVNQSISWISKRMNLSPKLEYTGGERGWIGDNPFIFLDISRISALGWKPKSSIEQAVILTLDWLDKNPEIIRKIR